MRFLPRPSAIISMAIALIFTAWWAWGPAPASRSVRPVWGNMRDVEASDRNPGRGPSEPDYCFYLGDVPIGFEVITFAALVWPVGLGLKTVSRWRAARAARRVGYCSACGYDLRASPQRCPECGREPRAFPANAPCDVHP